MQLGALRFLQIFTFLLVCRRTVQDSVYLKYLQIERIDGGMAAPHNAH